MSTHPQLSDRVIATNTGRTRSTTAAEAHPASPEERIPRTIEKPSLKVWILPFGYGFTSVTAARVQ